MAILLRTALDAVIKRSPSSLVTEVLILFDESTDSGTLKVFDVDKTVMH
jgi:hypothetical protein